MVCPSDEILRRFLNDAEQETSSTDVMSHVITCPDCQSRISTWNEQPRLDAILQAAGNCEIDYANTPPDATGHGPDALTNVYGRTPLRRIGHYELLRSIGRGGGGEVFEARHTLLRRRVALKLLSQRNSVNDVARQRFFREMESIGQLDDPYIVHAYDAGEVDGTLYLAMELVDGENVESLARRLGPLPVSDACEIIRQAALGLQHVHQSGLVHRDLKPSNLLMSSNGVKIADLGLALLNRTEPLDDRLTGEHTVLGTADYMAPEQAEGSHAVDIRADIYSLGCTLFRLLAGRAPYSVPENATPLKKLWAHASEPIPDIRQLRAEIPAELAALLQTLMAKDRENRLSTPIQLADALAPFCRTLDFPSLVVPAGAVGTGVQPRSSTARDPSSPHLSGSGSSQPTEVQAPASARQRWAMPAISVLICLVVGFAWWRSQNGTRPVENSTSQPVETSTTNSNPGASSSASQSPAAPHQQRPPEPLGPLALQWQTAFTNAPSDINWPGRPATASWRLDEDLRALVIHANKGIRLVKLGELKGDKIGEVRLGMKADVLSDKGSFGFFLGFRQLPVDAKSAVEFQAIEILWLDKMDGKRKTLVRRCLTTIDRDNGSVNTRQNEHIACYLPENTQKITFEIVLRDDLLAHVQVAGSNCSPLYADDLNRQFSIETYRGDFGVFAKGATLEFSSPLFDRAP